MLKQSSSKSLLASAAEGTSPKVRWGHNVNLEDKEVEEELETAGASTSNLEEVLEKQDTEVSQLIRGVGGEKIIETPSLCSICCVLYFEDDEDAGVPEIK